MMRKISIAILTVVVVVVLFLTLCTFKQRPYEHVILDRFGRVIDKPTNIAYGWYLCLPIDSVVRLDRRLHLYQSVMSEIGTRNGEPIAVKAFAAWSISDPSLFYKNFKGDDQAAQKFIGTKIPGKVAEVLSKHTLDQIFNTDETKLQTTEMETYVTEQARQDMKAQGIYIAQVGFSRMAFPPNVATAVYDRMAAERNKMAAAFRSEGASEAERIRADGDSRAAIIQSEANRKAEALKGEGESEALKILAETQTTEAQEFYKFWRSLKLYETSLGKGTYLVLTPDDPMISTLFKRPGAEEKK